MRLTPVVTLVLLHVTIELLNADILAGNAAIADSSKSFRFILMVGELQLTDTFYVALLNE